MNSNSKPHISVSYLFLYSLYIFYTFLYSVLCTQYIYMQTVILVQFLSVFSLRSKYFFFTRCIFRYIRATNVFFLLFWFAPVFNFISSIVIVLMLIGICCRMMFWEKLNFSGLFIYCYWTLSDPSRALYPTLELIYHVRVLIFCYGNRESFQYVGCLRTHWNDWIAVLSQMWVQLVCVCICVGLECSFLSGGFGFYYP